MTETVALRVTFTVEVDAEFVTETIRHANGEETHSVVLDEVDEDALYHAVLEKLNDGDFDYEVEE